MWLFLVIIGTKLVAGVGNQATHGRLRISLRKSHTIEMLQTIVILVFVLPNVHGEDVHTRALYFFGGYPTQFPTFPTQSPTQSPTSRSPTRSPVECKDNYICGQGHLSSTGATSFESYCRNEVPHSLVFSQRDSLSGYFGSKADVECSPGYIGGGIWKCDDSGKFSGPPCLPADCNSKLVPNSDHGSVQVLTGKTGATIAVQCNDGFHGSDGNAKTVDWICESNGLFSGNDCFEGPCKEPIETEHYRLYQTEFFCNCHTANVCPCGKFGDSCENDIELYDMANAYLDYAKCAEASKPFDEAVVRKLETSYQCSRKMLEMMNKLSGEDSNLDESKHPDRILFQVMKTVHKTSKDLCNKYSLRSSDILAMDVCMVKDSVSGFLKFGARSSVTVAKVSPFETDFFIEAKVETYLDDLEKLENEVWKFESTIINMEMQYALAKQSLKSSEILKGDVGILAANQQTNQDTIGKNQETIGQYIKQSTDFLDAKAEERFHFVKANQDYWGKYGKEAQESLTRLQETFAQNAKGDAEVFIEGKNAIDKHIEQQFKRLEDAEVIKQKLQSDMRVAIDKLQDLAILLQEEYDAWKTAQFWKNLVMDLIETMVSAVGTLAACAASLGVGCAVAGAGLALQLTTFADNQKQNFERQFGEGLPAVEENPMRLKDSATILTGRMKELGKMTLILPNCSLFTTKTLSSLALTRLILPIKRPSHYPSDISRKFGTPLIT